MNTVFEDLKLNRGAVSNAILGVAGAKLQQLVNAKNATGNVGEVIVTDGCNLKSKQVFHVVTPHWDNGQGTAEKVKCYQLHCHYHDFSDLNLMEFLFTSCKTSC